MTWFSHVGLKAHWSMVPQTLVTWTHDVVFTLRSQSSLVFHTSNNQYLNSLHGTHIEVSELSGLWYLKHLIPTHNMALILRSQKSLFFGTSNSWYLNSQHGTHTEVTELTVLWYLKYLVPELTTWYSHWGNRAHWSLVPITLDIWTHIMLTLRSQNSLVLGTSNT